MRPGSAEDIELSNLMQRANDGDEMAYEQLLMRLLPILRNFVDRRVNRMNGGEDVVQEILLSIHKARHTFDATRPFLPWMRAIAQFRIADHWRRKIRVSGQEIVDENLVDAASVDVAFNWDDGLSVLENALSKLNGRQRDVVTLLKVEGLSIKEAATRLGISESALKVTAHRAYKALKEGLEATDH